MNIQCTAGKIHIEGKPRAEMEALSISMPHTHPIHSPITMAEQGVSQLFSMELTDVERLVAAE